MYIRMSYSQVSIIGNIVNGLSQADLAAIDENKLKLNNFFIQKQRGNSKTKKGVGNSGTTNDTGRATENREINKSKENNPRK